MTSFFAPEPEPEPAPPRPVYRQDGSFAPPNGVLGGVVGVESVITRSEAIVVALECLVVYPAGFALDVHILGSVELPTDVLGRRGPGSEGGVLVGVGFADGRRGTSGPAGDDDGLRVNFGGGGGGGGRMAIRCYVGTLPPLGALTVAAAWPAAGVPEGTVELDAARVLEAAARSQMLFELPDRPPDDPDATGWERYRPG